MSRKHDQDHQPSHPFHEGEEATDARKQHFMDVDRMVNEGLGGGEVTRDNGFIDRSTTDTMDEPDFVLQQINRSFGQGELDDEEEGVRDR